MTRFAIGSYTVHPTLDARGRGISIVDWDEETDTCREVSVSDAVTNPSYLARGNRPDRIYAVSEVDDRMGAAAAFSLGSAGDLQYLGQSSGRRKSACHITILPVQKRILTASYSDGSLSTYSLVPEGVGELVASRDYRGHGPNPERQAGPHAHQITLSPWGGRLYLCDLGSDAVWMHQPGDTDHPENPAQIALEVPPGYGPRHLAYDPVLPLAYILCELLPRLLVAAIDPETGVMRILEEHDTVAEEQMTISAPAAVKVHPSGQTLAVSNRFDDTIAVFAILRAGGEGGSSVRLSLVNRFPCGGKAPRDIEFNTTGNRLLIANQDSHNISCRHFDPQSGLPVEDWASGYSTGSPVCILALD